jgi:hypothetical protein
MVTDSAWAMADYVRVTPPVDTDGLWAAYHHIAKLRELGADERGNQWNQRTWGQPVSDAWTVDLETRSYLGPYVPAGELCGTGMCFAGWYCCLKGVKMDGHGMIMDADRRRVPVYLYAALAAGLAGDPWVNALFAPHNDLARIADVLTQITGKDRR